MGLIFSQSVNTAIFVPVIALKTGLFTLQNQNGRITTPPSLPSVYSEITSG